MVKEYQGSVHEHTLSSLSSGPMPALVACRIGAIPLALVLDLTNLGGALDHGLWMSEPESDFSGVNRRSI